MALLLGLVVPHFLGLAFLLWMMRDEPQEQDDGWWDGRGDNPLAPSGGRPPLPDARQARRGGRGPHGRPRWTILRRGRRIAEPEPVRSRPPVA